MQSSSQRRMAKKKKQLVLAGKGTRTDYFDIYGADAKPEVIWKVPERHPMLKLEDFQGLVSWILADGMNPSWIFIKNKPLVSKIVLVYLPGLDAALYTSHVGLLQNFKICCGAPKAVKAISPMTNPASTVDALLTCPRRKRKAEADDEKAVKIAKANNHERKAGTKLVHAAPPLSSPLQYVVSQKAMEKNGYPMPEVSSDGKIQKPPEGFVMTRPASGSAYLDMVAVDCEMCYTAAGLELTRISMVDRDGKVLLDSLVKPSNPITDYNTRYSGITERMMEKVTTTLKDVQDKVLEIVQAETIMIGHSLESDLTALKIVHLKVIDTALLYQLLSTKPALRVLASRHLDRKIQDKIEGHDSVEDARAAIDLVSLRIQKGPTWCMGPRRNREDLVTILNEHSRRCSILDRKSVVQRYATGACDGICCESDDDAMAKVAKELGKGNTDFVWTQLTALNSFFSQRARDPTQSAAYWAEMAALKTCQKVVDGKSQTVGPPITADLETILRKLNSQVLVLHEALPRNAMLILMTGHGDTSSVRQLHAELARRKASPDASADRSWSESRQLVLEELQIHAETALGFVTIKK